MTRERSHPLTAKIAPGEAFYDTIEEAYRTFKYPKPKSIGVCERCCMDLDIEKDFFNPPIRELPLSYLRDWYFAAYDPKTFPKEPWAYLLPRILEILAVGEELSSNGIEVALNRFQTGKPENWSAREWDVLDKFQRAFLAAKIKAGEDHLDDILCMFALSGWNVPDLLDQVSSTEDAVLAQRLWADWCERRAPGREDIWLTAFWESPGNNAAYAFYTSRELSDRMEALALADGTDPELAAKAEAVAKVINSNR